MAKFCFLNASLLTTRTTAGSGEPSDGWVAEWLCSGLQSRVRRFDSGLSLT